MEDHLALTTVAEKLDVSPRTVKRLVEKGHLKAINLNEGGQRVTWRFAVSEIERFLSERAVA